MTSARSISQADIAPLAQLWHDVWHESQAAAVPDELVVLRTLPDFERRLKEMAQTVRATGPIGAPDAFCAIGETPDDDSGTVELYQLFVSPTARRTGAGRTLMTDAHTRMRAAGHDRAHLKCLSDNTLALRFYEDCGWTNTGIKQVTLDTSEGPYDIPCTVLTKDL